MLGKPFPLGLGIGIMARKDNASLMARVNQTLMSMQSNGSYSKIYKTYFGDIK
jgi:ABC-type amino acid transport substrate-binding protein